VQHLQEIGGRRSRRKCSATTLHSVNAGGDKWRTSVKVQREPYRRLDRYTHYYRNEFPERFHPLMDTRRWGPGERLVSEPYTKEAHAETFDWITRHGIFAESALGHLSYGDSVLSLAAAR
jgi:hypothetical protein